MKNTVMPKLRGNLRAISVMPHISAKVAPTELAKNTNGHKIRLQSAVRVVYISETRKFHTGSRRNTSARTCVRVRARIVWFAAGRRGKIVPFGRLFERFATSLFELSIS